MPRVGVARDTANNPIPACDPLGPLVTPVTPWERPRPGEVPATPWDPCDPCDPLRPSLVTPGPPWPTRDPPCDPL
eukprot:181619-Prymnesium_polylepis.1